MRPVCLTIGGSDSGGGAGIQADLKVFDRLGCHGCSAITALTAQNPYAVLRIEPVSLAQMEAELHAVFDYFDVAVVKTGMLSDAEHIALLSGMLDVYHAGRLLVVDPVMVSSSGQRLLERGSEQALLSMLIEKSTLVTPNLEEARLFAGDASLSAEDLLNVLAQSWPGAILLKGGHDEGEMIEDRLRTPDGETHRFAHPRLALDDRQGHGTGCRLAAAIAAELAQGHVLTKAVGRAENFLAAWLQEQAD